MIGNKIFSKITRSLLQDSLEAVEGETKSRWFDRETLEINEKKSSSGITQTKDIVKVISSLENRRMLLLKVITGKVISQQGG